MKEEYFRQIEQQVQLFSGERKEKERKLGSREEERLKKSSFQWLSGQRGACEVNQEGTDSSLGRKREKKET